MASKKVEKRTKKWIIFRDLDMECFAAYKEIGNELTESMLLLFSGCSINYESMSLSPTLYYEADAKTHRKILKECKEYIDSGVITAVKGRL